MSSEEGSDYHVEVAATKPENRVEVSDDKREADAVREADEEKAVQEDGEDKRREEEDKERADRAAEAEKKAPIREDEEDKELEEMRGGYFGGEV